MGRGGGGGGRNPAGGAGGQSGRGEEAVQGAEECESIGSLRGLTLTLTLRCGFGRVVMEREMGGDGKPVACTLAGSTGYKCKKFADAMQMWNKCSTPTSIEIKNGRLSEKKS